MLVLGAPNCRGVTPLLLLLAPSVELDGLAGGLAAAAAAVSLLSADGAEGAAVALVVTLAGALGV